MVVNVSHDLELFATLNLHLVQRIAVLVAIELRLFRVLGLCLAADALHLNLSWAQVQLAGNEVDEFPDSQSAIHREREEFGLSRLCQETLDSDVFNSLAWLVDVEVGPNRCRPTNFSVAQRVPQHLHCVHNYVSLLAPKGTVVALERTPESPQTLLHKVRVDHLALRLEHAAYAVVDLGEEMHDLGEQIEIPRRCLLEQ